jgi:MscS family membrane protein
MTHVKAKPTRWWAIVASSWVFGLSLLSEPSTAQQPDTIAQQIAEPPISPASPRAALSRFFELAGDQRFDEAARFLDVPDSLRRQAPELARQLKAVLDRHLLVDLEQISREDSGDLTDNLPADIEHLGTIPTPDGAFRPVRLVRATADPDVPWRFARQTVLLVPAAYASLEDRWLLDFIPEPLQRDGPFRIALWQWIALPLLVGLSWALGHLIAGVGRRITVRITSRTRTTWDDALIGRVGAPLAMAIGLAVFASLLPLLGLHRGAADAFYRIIRAGVYVSIFWGLWRLVNLGHGILSASAWALTTPSSRALLPLGARVAKAMLIAIAVVSVLSMLGFPIASLLAGLGIGGLALALAAQKTVENLFGAFSIGADQPFREGDFVKVEDFVGTVESIGLRSTRFRTLDRTLITIPNGKLAEMRLETFAARDRLRLFVVVGLVYDTTPAQMREVLGGIEGVLRAHPKLWPDSFTVRFRNLGESSLDIEIMAWFTTSEWAEFLLIRQEILLQIMEVVEKAGTSIAFPTRTVHLIAGENGAPLPGADARGSAATGGVPSSPPGDRSSSDRA